MPSGLHIPLVLPDLWQQEAVQALRAGEDVIVNAPTGAGKTWVFELYCKQAALKGQAVYTVPTRALANDKYAEWSKAGWKVGLATGDRAENLQAPVLVATLETQRERFLRRQGPALLVIDEYQMIGDQRRGLNYEIVLALASQATQLLLLSGSVANPEDVSRWLQRLGRSVRVVSVTKRPVPLDDLPAQAIEAKPPQALSGFLPRMMVAALMADLGPILLFCPRRHEAEKIARQLASHLPDDQPLALTPEQERACGKELRKLLKRRVAWHHSGLSYAVRAGIVEPLARAGHLRIIVATTGLAAGINFSVRSVYLTGRRYRDGPFEQELRPDELLQMFGRAGRRGLDEQGYVLSSDRSPRLSDAQPLHLTRSRQIDWPTLLRVMKAAADLSQPPFEAATTLCSQLFSKQTIQLGHLASQRPAPPPEEDNPFATEAKTREFLNRSQRWERFALHHKPEKRPLKEVWVREKKAWKPATQSLALVSAALPGRTSKTPKEPSWSYLREIVAGIVQETGLAKIPPVAAKLLGKSRRRPHYLPLEDLLEAFLARFRLLHPEAVLQDWEQRGKELVVRFSAEDCLVPAIQDEKGFWLHHPPVREIAHRPETDLQQNGVSFEAAPHSPVRSWRRLGLIAKDGTPTLRGEIFSFFQGGEGLVMAAALEHPHYRIEDMVYHLANLRAGRRFSLRGGGESEMLAVVTRELYGTLSLPGYLENGLPPSYGSGAAERLFSPDPLLSAEPEEERLSAGDLERARSEWLSLLRHLSQAPSLPCKRWSFLQHVARETLAAEEVPDRSLESVRIRPEQLAHKPRLRLTLASLRR
ncbi:MAG: DEAD/DEAH box helicase [Verrucomicrobiota bacterium]